MNDREKARDLGNQSAALARSIAGVLNDTLDALEAAEARVTVLEAALTKIVAMKPVEPLEHQEFLGGEYLPYGPVNGCARAAVGKTS